jgi:hypothetical protein
LALALVSRGWFYGRDLFHVAFPLAGHNEHDWGFRSHLPLQLMAGHAALASRIKHLPGFILAEN